MNKSQWCQYLTTQQAQFCPNDSNIITSFADSNPQESKQTASITPLLYQGLLSISGPDSAKFLQGQLSCDVHSASPQHSLLGAACSPQGRMFSSFRLLQKNSDTEAEFILRMRNDLVTTTHETLHKYSVFFKTQLKNASDEWLGLGIWGEQCEQLISETFGLDEIPQQVGEVSTNETAIVIRLAGETPRFECWCKAEKTTALWTELITQASPTATDRWILEDIQQGIGELCHATQDTFNPHMLNFQAIDAISFDKGCYTGQEIIARTHYRGKSKRHMQRFSLCGGEPLAPGTELYDADSNKTIATVVSSAVVNQQERQQEQQALLVSNVGLDTSSPLTLQADEQRYTATLLPLPYTLDS
jgi:tRNA-modifying protein YgfZ